MTDDPCVPWWGRCGQNGYGVFRQGRVLGVEYAHRRIYEEAFGLCADVVVDAISVPGDPLVHIQYICEGCGTTYHYDSLRRIRTQVEGGTCAGTGTSQTSGAGGGFTASATKRR